MIHLKEWSIHPFAGTFVAVGKRFGQIVRTSEIVEVIDTLTFRTISGSVYVLTGSAHERNEPDLPLEECRRFLEMKR